MKNGLLLVTALAVAYHFVVLDACCAGEHAADSQITWGASFGEPGHQPHEHPAHGHDDFHEGHASATLDGFKTKSVELAIGSASAVAEAAIHAWSMDQDRSGPTSTVKAIDLASPSRWSALYCARGAFLS